MKFEQKIVIEASELEKAVSIQYGLGETIDVDEMLTKLYPYERIEEYQDFCFDDDSIKEYAEDENMLAVCVATFLKDFVEKEGIEIDRILINTVW